ncbi:hypothetical protein BGX33_011174 [Mortierella sp. NVP41]|nr:hypothetical protein BGX33_011174 [Mortierella sp. NVP41]
MCSPDSEVKQRTQGSDLERRLRPSTSLGRSAAFLHSTATWTTGETENLMTFKLWAVSEVVMILRCQIVGLCSLTEEQQEAVQTITGPDFAGCRESEYERQTGT